MGQCEVVWRRDGQYAQTEMRHDSLALRSHTPCRVSPKPHLAKDNMATAATNTASDFNQWLHAMKMVARLPGGMPPEFRRKLWLALAEQHLQSKSIDWSKEEEKCMCEEHGEDDEELGIQIVKDLHRTGSSLCSGPAGSVNQGKLKRVLLGYARWNPEVGYCQGFNMLGALILQVMDKDDVESLKVMIYLVEGILPSGYFCGSLGGLQADMAVFLEILSGRLPKLAKHLQRLQGPIGEGILEPPLTNVFTMQWFLTLFCTCLPINCVLRVWDLVLIEGSDILLRTALAIWGLLEERILATKSADDFYCKMGLLSGELLNGHLFDSNGLIQKVVDLGPIPELQKMRDKHLHSVTPWKRGLKILYSDEEGDSDDDARLEVSTAWGLRLGRRGSFGMPTAASRPASDGRERIALDISILKRQYEKLRERQRQAHIILTSTSRQNVEVAAPSLPVNQYLLGRNAIVSSKGRRIGPPAGAIPPIRKAQSVKTSLKLNPTKPQKNNESPKVASASVSRHSTKESCSSDAKALDETSTETHMLPLNKSSSVASTTSSTSEVSGASASIRSHKKSESSSYSEDSDGNSSTSTSLCDEDNFDGSLSSVEVSPLRKPVNAGDSDVIEMLKTSKLDECISTLNKLNLSENCEILTCVTGVSSQKPLAEKAPIGDEMMYAFEDMKLEVIREETMSEELTEEPGGTVLLGVTDPDCMDTKDMEVVELKRGNDYLEYISDRKTQTSEEFGIRNAEDNSLKSQSKEANLELKFNQEEGSTYKDYINTISSGQKDLSNKEPELQGCSEEKVSTCSTYLEYIRMKSIIQTESSKSTIFIDDGPSLEESPNLKHTEDLKLSYYTCKDDVREEEELKQDSTYQDYIRFKCSKNSKFDNVVKHEEEQKTSSHDLEIESKEDFDSTYTEYTNFNDVTILRNEEEHHKMPSLEPKEDISRKFPELYTYTFCEAIKGDKKLLGSKSQTDDLLEHDEQKACNLESRPQEPRELDECENLEVLNDIRPIEINPVSQYNDYIHNKSKAYLDEVIICSEVLEISPELKAFEGSGSNDFRNFTNHSVSNTSVFHGLTAIRDDNAEENTKSTTIPTNQNDADKSLLVSDEKVENNSCLNDEKCNQDLSEEKTSVISALAVVNTDNQINELLNLNESMECNKCIEGIGLNSFAFGKTGPECSSGICTTTKNIDRRSDENLLLEHILDPMVGAESTIDDVLIEHFTSLKSEQRELNETKTISYDFESIEDIRRKYYASANSNSEEANVKTIETRSTDQLIKTSETDDNSTAQVTMSNTTGNLVGKSVIPDEYSNQGLTQFEVKNQLMQEYKLESAFEIGNTSFISQSPTKSSIVNIGTVQSSSPESANHPSDCSETSASVSRSTVRNVPPHDKIGLPLKANQSPTVITSTSQLSPIVDFSTYLRTSSISPLRTPASSYLMHYTQPIMAEPPTKTVSTVETEDAFKFKVNDEGVTNEYFERVTVPERPSRLELRSSTSDDATGCVFVNDDLTRNIHLNAFVCDSPDTNQSGGNKTGDDVFDDNFVNRSFAIHIEHSFLKEKSISLDEPSVNREEFKPTSCPENTTDENTYGHQFRKSERVSKIIQENSMILHRLLKRNACEEDDGAGMGEKKDTGDNGQDFIVQPNVTDVNDDGMALNTMLGFKSLDTKDCSSNVVVIKPNNSPFDIQCTPDLAGSNHRVLYEDPDSKPQSMSVVTPMQFLDKRTPEIKCATTTANPTIDAKEDNISFTLNITPTPCSDQIENKTNPQSPIENSSISRFGPAPTDISETLSSIKNTIKSIDSLCKREDRDQRSRDKTMDIIESMNEIRFRKNDLSKSSVETDRATDPPGNDLISVPTSRRFSRDIRREISPRRCARDSEREEYESLFKRETSMSRSTSVLPSNSRDLDLDRLYQLSEQQTSEELSTYSLRNSFPPINFSYADPNRSYESNIPTVKISNDRLDSSPAQPSIYAPPEKRDIRHTTVTSTFYDRIKAQQKERTVRFDRSPTTIPTPVIITKAYLNSLRLTPSDQVDSRHLKSAESSPSRYLKKNDYSGSLTTFVVPPFRRDLNYKSSFKSCDNIPQKVTVTATGGKSGTSNTVP